MAAVKVRRLNDIYLSADPGLLDRLCEVAARDAEAVAEAFYAELRARPDALPFLGDERFAAGLRRALTEWLAALFRPRHSAAVYDLIRRQREIGKTHARLNIPMPLMAEGMRVVGQELRERVLRSDIGPDQARTEALAVVGEVLDQCLSIINAAYTGTTVAEERDVYALRMRLAGGDLAAHCEKLRSELFRWLAQTVAGLHGRRPAREPATLRQSEFGVWVLHKAELLISDAEEVARLRERVAAADRILEHALACSRLAHAFSCRDSLHPASAAAGLDKSLLCVTYFTLSAEGAAPATTFNPKIRPRGAGNLYTRITRATASKPVRH